jgi:DNA polymerase
LLWLDSETYNEKPIKHGTYIYASTCEPLIVTYALNHDPVETWDRTAQPRMPEYLEYLLEDTDELITAHNAMFDRNVLKYGLKKDIPIPRWRCNMVRALAHALPGGLDILCEVLEVEQDLRKQKQGKKLIQLFCKPQAFRHSVPKAFGTLKQRKAEIERLRALWSGRATRHTHPEEWAEFLLYAGNDIAAMRALDTKLPRWNYEGEELALWHLDQEINDRGFMVDVDLAQAAVRAVERAKKALAKQTREMTHEEVESATKRDQLLAHILREYGIDLPDMQKSTLERRIQDENLPRELRELLAVRMQASSTSTSKYQALLNGVMPDGRLRGALQFSGAGRTRRWAGRTFQPQNLPRPTLKYEAIEAGIAAMKGDYEDLIYEDVMGLASNAVRGCIVAPPGKKLVVADLANIEGRDGAWLAGEEWKLQAFRDYDTIIGRDEKGKPIRKGFDLYILAYAKAFKLSPEEVTKLQRQIGKVMELMLQYEGGVGAYATGADTYGIDLEALAEVAWETLPAEAVYEATSFLEWVREEKRPTFGLSDRAFITCDALKRLWRRGTSAIATIWPELKDGAINAIENPGNTFEVRRFKLRRDGAWLRILLPSGRYLTYPSPQVKGGAITYMGNNQYTRKWQRLGTYGGKIFENACQGLAGDFLKANMPRIEAAGYEIVLTVHDEVVTEAPDKPEFNAAHLSELLATVPAWAPDMPLAAAGFSTYRYRKED